MALTLSAIAFVAALAAIGFSFLTWKANGSPKLTSKSEEKPNDLTQQIPVIRQQSNRVLFPPAMVGEMTLRDWLRYHWQAKVWNQGDVWAHFVDHFYEDAAYNPHVSPFFQGHDLYEIKRKFLATLLIITHSGVTEAAATTLIERHKHLGITARAYDETIAALVRTMKKYQVPPTVVPQMQPMVHALREGLVTK